VDLPPLAVGGPFGIAVEGKTSLLIKDVLVGEVWLCAGQSNLRFPLGSSCAIANLVATRGAVSQSRSLPGSKVAVEREGRTAGQLTSNHDGAGALVSV
jgi:hypothetical protein